MFARTAARSLLSLSLLLALLALGCNHGRSMVLEDTLAQDLAVDAVVDLVGDGTGGQDLLADAAPDLAGDLMTDTAGDAPQDLGLDTPDWSGLGPDDLIFAVGRGGGMSWGFGTEFYWSIHPDFVLYVYGAGRFVRQDQATKGTLGYRVFREGQLSQETFDSLLGLAARVSDADSGSYQNCGMMDGPTESLFAALPGLNLNASSWSSFAGEPGCENGTDAWDPPPPQRLIDLFTALQAITSLPAQVLATDALVLGAVAAPSNDHTCTLATALAWPFEDPALPVPAPSDNIWKTTLQGTQATQVRDLLRGTLSLTHHDDEGTCVSQEDNLYLVFYADRLPDEASLPF